MNWGQVSALDGVVLEQSVLRAAQTFPGQPLRMLEVGVRDGGSSQAIKAVLDSLGRSFEYTGIDNQVEGIVTPPFPEAQLLLGDSVMMAEQVPAGLHWVFVDGCHCYHHVKADIRIYGAKLCRGGVMAIHDTAMAVQGYDNGYRCQVYPDDGPNGLIQPRKAIREMELLASPYWFVVADVEEPNATCGGVVVVAKLY